MNRSQEYFLWLPVALIATGCLGEASLPEEFRVSAYISKWNDHQDDVVVSLRGEPPGVDLATQPLRGQVTIELRDSPASTRLGGQRVHTFEVNDEEYTDGEDLRFRIPYVNTGPVELRFTFTEDAGPTWRTEWKEGGNFFGVARRTAG